MTSKRLDESDDDGDELGCSPFENSVSSPSQSNLDLPPLSNSKRTASPSGNDDDSLSHKLMGSSEERELFFNELDQQLRDRESEQMDREKEERGQQEKQSVIDKVADLIQKTKEEAEELENLRLRRELRVSREPEDGSDNCVSIRVRHQLLGIVSRNFGNESFMSAVYDWIGSLNVSPKFFSLSTRPEEVIYPDENIAKFSGTVLCMTDVDEPLSKDEHEVSFFNGKVDVPISVEGNVNLEDYSSLFPLSEEPPDILLSGEESATHSSKVTSTESYPILEGKRQQENEKLVD